MENEISPGVKVQVRGRDGAPTKQTPAPRFAAEISERVPPAPQGAAPLTVQRKDGVRFLVTDKRGSALASFDCCVI